MSGIIKISFRGLPLSANHAYFDRPGGGRVLKAAGKGYKTEVSAFIVRYHQNEIRDLQKDRAYGLAIKLVSPNIENAGWPHKAATRYKKFDISNRVKLLEDALMEAFGIDDCQILDLYVSKRKGEEETTHVLFWDLESVDHATAFAAYQRL